ncbi:Hypothetical protein HVPorG_00016 [Roseomonas mucosa]|uniref:Uncharacterized protein n=1 Tax=Roseomonas mucosa TaxID=207340 RepID=A0A1S8DBL9_9PROT|nr:MULTISPECIES: hypothetical protein [Roseomonas]MBS5904201.1 hypothetical protein [Acetobacteraceae bacterium]MCG7351564.1 hypothetical protein [Roseomonas mucosa]MCG7355387.1 hypothetical protein [Roseomonas mucosa]MDT8276510.1 hypothetical protein [Roseomonas mucosa]MDT8290846.1 hypothetical protein [Roseomonas mucosa]
MAQRHVTILALALAAGVAPIAVQAQTTLTPSEATPRDNSGAGSTARELKPEGNLPTSQATFGATPRDNSRVGSEPRELRPLTSQPSSQATPGSTPRDTSSVGSEARGGPGTGPFQRRQRGAAPAAPSKAAPTAPAATGSGTGVVIGGPDAAKSTSNINGAFLGGGGAFERMPDGSLRQVQ